MIPAAPASRRSPGRSSATCSSRRRYESDELRTHILAALARVAPEVRGRALTGDTNLRDALDLDSMDVLNFAVALHREIGVEIAESDYPRMATLESLTALLAEKLRARRP